MTIAEVDREVKNVIREKSVYGLESICHAIARAAQGQPYMDKEYCVNLLAKAFDHIEEWGE